MAKVKYYAKENTKVGTHSFYAVPVPNGTLTFNEVCEEACRNTSIEPSIMKAAVAEYMKNRPDECAEGLPCSCRRAVHHGISEPERLGEGHEGQADR